MTTLVSKLYEGNKSPHNMVGNKSNADRKLLTKTFKVLATLNSVLYVKYPLAFALTKRPKYSMSLQTNYKHI